MRLGEHRVGLRRRVTTDTRDEYGDQVTTVTVVEVRHCLFTPTARTSEYGEPPDRSGPVVHGSECLLPPGTEVGAEDVVVYPITSRTEVDGVLTDLDGTTWQIVGDPRVWHDAVELWLRRSR